MELFPWASSRFPNWGISENSRMGRVAPKWTIVRIAGTNTGNW